MGAELEAVGVRDGARELYGAIRELRRYDLIDGVAFEARKHVGNCVFCAFDELDDDRVLEQRRNPAADARAGLGVLSRTARSALCGPCAVRKGAKANRHGNE